MNDQLKILFEINLIHHYFKDNEQLGLVITPDDSTAEMFKNIGFMYQSIQNQFKLFFNASSDLSNQLSKIKKVTQKNYFEFRIISNRLDFDLYTELPPNLNGTINYSNKNVSSIAEKLQLVPVYNQLNENYTVGIIKIYFDELIEQFFEECHYSITFHARKTQWNYYIINRSHIELNNPFIKMENSNLFGDSEHVTLPTGDQALLFSSGKNLIPLTNVSKQRFDLADYVVQPNEIFIAQKKVKYIYSGLPIATPSNTIVKRKDDEVVYTSNMYVYI